MKKLTLLLSITIFYQLFAITKEELHPGDVVLLPLNCMLCKAIEDAEQTSFSHSGLILWDQYKRPFVVEALGSVRAVSLESFLKRAPVGRPAYIYRSIELAKVSKLELLSTQMVQNYQDHFEGAGFDHDFLWDNVDQSGREIYYCSEFVTKLLNNFLTTEVSTYPMDFTENMDYWLTYFKGNVPQGKPGNSPGSFTRDENFVNLGSILN